MSRTRVLAAGARDAAAVLALLRRQFRELEIAVPAARQERAVRGALRDPARGTFLLLHVGGPPAGVAYLSYQWTLEHGGRIAWLEELYVEPEQRSRGLGARLLRAALREARRRGCAAVDLEVETAHPRAANLYRRHGFRQLGRTRFVRRLARTASP